MKNPLLRILFQYLLVLCVWVGLAIAVFADEPTTIVRHRGKAGLAEHLESKGKAAKEITVRVRLGKTIGDVVIQERVAIKGSDVFESKPEPERKSTVKERPQPASVKPMKAKVGR